MRVRKSVLTILVSLFVFSCSKDFSPVSNEPQFIFLPHGSDTVGVYIDFTDTCSYDFVISFLAEYDSVEIIEAQLGIDLFLYADSGDAEYWFNYFKDDSLYYSISTYTRSDSLTLIFKFLNEEYYINYKDNLINHRNLHFERIYIYNKTVVLKVPKDSETFWVDYFRQFTFIEFVDLLVVCYGG